MTFTFDIKMASAAESCVLPWLDPNYEEPGTPKEYDTLEKFTADYWKKKSNFQRLSTPKHEHNSFSTDHQSTLSQFGYEELGRSLTRYLVSSGKKYTIVEIGVGTGFGTRGLVENLNPTMVVRYICTEPFNKICEFPDTPVPVSKHRMNLDETIKMISEDGLIGPMILLVVCPPPLHDRDYELARQLVSTDVMALFESAECQKIEQVIIVRYDEVFRTDLDGTSDFYSYFVKHFKHFGMWIHAKRMVIESYVFEPGYVPQRVLDVFVRPKLIKRP